MLVDVIFPGWVPFAYLAVSANVPGWLTAHDKALAYPFETLVGGHLTRLGTRADVAVQQEYLEDLRSETTAALSHPSVLGAAFDPRRSIRRTRGPFRDLPRCGRDASERHGGA